MASLAGELSGSFPKANAQVRSVVGAARNPACKRRVALEVVGRMRLGEVAAACGARATLTPSIIATTRGRRFETALLNGTAERLRAALQDALNCRVDEGDVTDLRAADGHDHLLTARAEATLQWLAQRQPGTAAIARSAVVPLQLGVCELMLEIDALLWTGSELLVVEVKSIAAIDGHVPGEDVAAAAGQSAVYCYATGVLLETLDSTLVQAPTRALLVTAKDFTFAAAVHPLDLAAHLPFFAVRLARLAEQVDDLAALPAQEDTIPLDARGLDQDSAAQVHAANRRAISQLPAHLVPGCLGSCPLWEVCRDEHRPTGAPATYGTTHAEQLAGIDTLQRAAALADGAPPAPHERDLAGRLQRLEALLRESASTHPSRRGDT